MKKIIPLCAASVIVLSGCLWPAVDGAPVFFVPYDQPIAMQPKYEYETYKPYKEDAIEKSSIDRDVAYYLEQNSAKMKEALRKSVVQVKEKYPQIFEMHDSFLVGSFLNVNNINKSEKAGRISAMGLTDALAKTSQAKYIRYKRDMITVKNNMVAPTAEATKAAEIFKTDVIVMGVYRLNNYDLEIRYAFYDAKSRAYIGEGFVTIPLDRKVSEFALDI